MMYRSLLFEEPLSTGELIQLYEKKLEIVCFLHKSKNLLWVVSSYSELENTLFVYILDWGKHLIISAVQYK